MDGVLGCPLSRVVLVVDVGVGKVGSRVIRAQEPGLLEYELCLGVAAEGTVGEPLCFISRAHHQGGFPVEGSRSGQLLPW